MSNPLVTFRQAQANLGLPLVKTHLPKQTAEQAFIIIDDDPGMAAVERININKVYKGALVSIFNDPAQGLEYIAHLKEHLGHANSIVLFLDIHMPKMNGFDVLDRLMSFKSLLPAQLKTYMLSSTLDDNDIEHALSYDITAGFICKPLTIERIVEVFGKTA